MGPEATTEAVARGALAEVTAPPDDIVGGRGYEDTPLGLHRGRGLDSPDVDRRDAPARRSPRGAAARLAPDFNRR